MTLLWTYSWLAEDLALQTRPPDSQDLDHSLSTDYIISYHPGAGDGRAKTDLVALLLVSFPASLP